MQRCYEDVAQGVTKLLRCGRLSPRERMAGPCFSCLTHTIRPTMASDLCCVTLLPRPDRTGKLIAKVKRNKGATPERESLDIHETANCGRNTTIRRVLNDSDGERTRRREDRWKPQSLEIDFFASFHSCRSNGISTEIPQSCCRC